MKTYETSEGPLEVVEYIVETAAKDDYTFVLTITEGEFTGKQIQLTNMRMHETDESLLEYDLAVSEGVEIDAIKPTVDKIILGILYEQIERSKNENPPTE